ncbi:MAG: hypothetical protein U5M50_09075 [Sphingobium sp.]|nr:hypothetical protein [Sphingobium sp.]
MSESDDPELQEMIETIREALAQFRGYADYWKWPLDRQLEERGVAEALSAYLIHAENADLVSFGSVKHDPPDVLLKSAAGKRIGVEVTELIDSDAAARHRFRKKRGEAQPYDWADWNAQRMSAEIIQTILRKDCKLSAHASDYDELYLAICTAEPMIDLALAQQAMSLISVDVKRIDRAFLLLSYHPALDENVYPGKIAILPIPLDKK